MKLQKLILASCILLAFTSKAQNKGHLSLGFGFSNPGGQMAAQDYDDSTSGYGKIGAAYSIRYEKNKTSGFGYFINFQNASVGYDMRAYLSDIERNSISGTVWTSYSSSKYNIKSINAGGQYVLNKEHKFKVTPFIGLGISFCRSYAADYSLRNGFSTYRVDYREDNQTVINLNYGYNLSYDLFEKLSIIYNINYQVQVPQFSNNYYVYINGINTNNYIEKKYQPLFFGVSTLGVRYRLGVK